MPTIIVPYDNPIHRAAVVRLWMEAFGYKTAHNRPELAIDKKLAVNDGLFFVAIQAAQVVGTIMAGYDGHRGWIYSVAVLPEQRNHGVGTLLMKHAEQALVQLGCMKINLQIAEGNEKVAGFYESLGYAVEQRINMGKFLPGNIPSITPSDF